MSDREPYEIKINLLDEKNNQYPLIFDKIKPKQKGKSNYLEGKKFFILKTESYITPKILDTIEYREKKKINDPLKTIRSRFVKKDNNRII